MSLIERFAWGVPFGLFAVVSAIGWYRDEREIRLIRRTHEAEMRALLGGGDETP